MNRKCRRISQVEWYPLRFRVQRQEREPLTAGGMVVQDALPS
jgi:hypothetical protein